jgi:hypothetical protein
MRRRADHRLIGRVLASTATIKSLIENSGGTRYGLMRRGQSGLR